MKPTIYMPSELAQLLIPVYFDAAIAGVERAVRKRLQRGRMEPIRKRQRRN